MKVKEYEAVASADDHDGKAVKVNPSEMNTSDDTWIDKSLL